MMDAELSGYQNSRSNFIDVEIVASPAKQRSMITEVLGGM
jgi:hypothetical protein